MEICLFLQFYSSLFLAYTTKKNKKGELMNDKDKDKRDVIKSKDF